MSWFSDMKQAIAKFIFLTPLHALELALGWFMVGTGLWIMWPPLAHAEQHPLGALIELGHLNALWVGAALMGFGFTKCVYAFLDFQYPTEWVRRLRVFTALGSLVIWASILITGFLWWPSTLWYRYVVLLISELWIIITGAHSRPGSWR